MAEPVKKLLHVARAGVIHLDVRLPNIMVRLPDVSNSKSNYSTMDTNNDNISEGNSRASAQDEKGDKGLELRLVDWNCSSRIGHPIHPTLLDNYRWDERYPSNLPIATAA